jgi:hypothetical protein
MYILRSCFGRCHDWPALFVPSASKCIPDRCRSTTTVNIGACFEALDEHIRRHLEIVMPSKAITIPLRSVGNSLYEGDVNDERCVGASRWLLEIRSPIGEADLIARVPQLVKVCSARFVVELVKRALPGLALKHLPVPPAEVAVKVESQYFVHQPDRTVLGEHRANAQSGSLCSRRDSVARNEPDRIARRKVTAEVSPGTWCNFRFDKPFKIGRLKDCDELVTIDKPFFRQPSPCGGCL